MSRLAIRSERRMLSKFASSRAILNYLCREHVTAKVLFLGGLILLSQGLYMNVKAILAQGLIAHSWQQRAAVSLPSKPWSWADTKAIAKLEVARLNKQLFVMQDDSGESLAFGPGHLSDSADISSSGHVMIAGHRDSHFEFLQQLKAGDVIKTTNYQSTTAEYRVSNIEILDINTDALILHDFNRLTLITCYPFKGFIPGGPLRYIINAERVDI